MEMCLLLLPVCRREYCYTIRYCHVSMSNPRSLRFFFPAGADADLLGRAVASSAMEAAGNM